MGAGVSSDLAECVTRQPHSNEALLETPPQPLEPHNEGILAAVRAERGVSRVGHSV